MQKKSFGFELVLNFGEILEEFLKILGKYRYWMEDPLGLKGTTTSSLGPLLTVTSGNTVMNKQGNLIDKLKLYDFTPCLLHL